MPSACARAYTFCVQSTRRWSPRGSSSAFGAGRSSNGSHSTSTVALVLGRLERVRLHVRVRADDVVVEADAAASNGQTIRLAAMLVAVAQIEPQLGEKERNLETCLARLDEAAAAGAELLVLPECALPGYMFDSAGGGVPVRRGDPRARRPRRSRRPAAGSGCTASAGCSSATATRSATPPCSSGRTASSGATGRRTCRSSASTASSCPGDELERLRHADRPDRARDLLRPALSRG